MSNNVKICEAVYIAPETVGNITKGMKALIRPSEHKGIVLAQFHDFHASRLSVDLAFGWHEFSDKCFTVTDKE